MTAIIARAVEIVGEITSVEPFATGRGVVRTRRLLVKRFGKKFACLGIFSKLDHYPRFCLPKDVSAGMHAFCAVRKKSPQTCETFSPSEKSLRRRVCLLKHPRKVSAAINTFSATGKFFVQRLPSWNTGREEELRTVLRTSPSNLIRRRSRRCGRSQR